MINVVLYEPEIPQNTGNIMRTCADFNAKLHLIEPLGFYLDEKHLRRAGMDYRNEIDLKIYPNWNSFKEKNQGTYFYMTRYGRKAPDDFNYREAEGDIYLIFGKESTGIPKEILYDDLEHCIRIPMVADKRCLNVSNTVAICVYEVVKQFNYDGLCRTESIKGEDFIEEYVKGEKR